MKAMGATAEDVLAALAESKLEVREDKLAVRRPGNLTLPTLEEKAQPFRKKTSIHAHDGGIIAIFRTIPAEQSWMQLKEKLREKLPSNVGIWFASEVRATLCDTRQCSRRCHEHESYALTLGRLAVVRALYLRTEPRKLACLCRFTPVERINANGLFRSTPSLARRSTIRHHVVW